MIYASSRNVTKEFCNQIDSALQLLERRDANWLQRLAFLNAVRFRRVRGAEAKEIIADYFLQEFAALQGSHETTKPEYILEIEPRAALVAMIKLTSPGALRSSGYGCSARRVGDDGFVVDLHSPVFGGNFHWLLT